LRVPLEAAHALVVYEGYPPGSMPGASQDDEVGLGVVMIERGRPFRAAVHQGRAVVFITVGRGRTLWEWRRIEVGGRGVIRRAASGAISLR
jgi:hypothetical protein